jgi:hypothetical protein
MIFEANLSESSKLKSNKFKSEICFSVLETFPEPASDNLYNLTMHAFGDLLREAVIFE